MSNTKKQTSLNNPFPEYAREKTLLVQMTRARGGNTYTIDRVEQVNEINQYADSTTKLNKREWTREFRQAAVEVA